MEELLTDTDFHEIAARDRAKVSNAVKKIGYTEGAFDGRASVFQAGFDVGYEQGFRNAFTTGRYQGLRVAHTKIDNQRSTDPVTLDLLLAKPTRGQCQICVNKELINNDIPNIVDIQTKHSNTVNATLTLRYKHLDAFVGDRTTVS